MADKKVVLTYEGLKKREEELEEFVCPECGTKAVIPSGGCNICLQCGYSKCN